MSSRGWRITSRDDIIYELSLKIGASSKGWRRLVFPREAANKLLLLWTRGVIANPYDSMWVDLKWRRDLFRMDRRSICS